MIFPASGTGAWEAALVNTLSPGDAVLMSRTGWFASLWSEMAKRLGLEPILLETDWRRGADPAAIEAALRPTTGAPIRAVCVVHNETSTGCTSRIAEVRRAIDAAGHPALLLVDTISSLASIDYRHDEWGVDVTVAGSQKGLMLPPGLSFNAISAQGAGGVRDGEAAAQLLGLAADARGQRPDFISPTRRPPTCCAACRRRSTMLDEEGLPNVFARHDRHGAATRARRAGLGTAGAVELQCLEPSDYSSSLTAVRLAGGPQRRRVARADLASGST